MQQIKKEALMRGFALALAFLGVAGTAEAASAAPAVTLSTTGNHPQGPVGVAGGGFGPGETVTFTFDTTQVLSLQADGTGAFSGKSLTVPAAAQPGTHTISAVGATTGDTVTSKFLVITNWSEEGYGPEHTGSNPYENTLSSKNISNLVPAWTRLPPIIPTSPVIFGAGRLFLGAYQLHGTTRVYGLAKVQALTGYLAWFVQLDGKSNTQVSTSPAIARNVVYVGATDNKVYAINGQTGSIIWTSATSATGTGIYGAPTVVDGIVYVGSLDGSVYALDADKGTKVWTFATGAKGVQSPTVVAGLVYVSVQSVSNNGPSFAYALNAKTGRLIWSRKFDQALSTQIVVAAGKAYMASIQDTIYALNAEDGAVLWSKSIGNFSEAFSNTLAAADYLYVAGADSTLYALSLTTGSVVWNQPLPIGASGPIIANDVIYIPSGNGFTYAFNAATGSQILTLRPGNLSFVPTLANGTLYLISGNLQAYALPASATKANQTAPRSDAVIK